MSVVIPPDVMHAAEAACPHVFQEAIRIDYAREATVRAIALAITAERKRAAAIVGKHDMRGREWIPESLWGSLTREAVARIESGEQP